MDHVFDHCFPPSLFQFFCVYHSLFDRDQNDTHIQDVGKAWIYSEVQQRPLLLYSFS